MIGAFLGVHRGDAELFKPPAAVRSLSLDTHTHTHGVCPHDPLRFVFSKVSSRSSGLPNSDTRSLGVFTCVWLSSQQSPLCPTSDTGTMMSNSGFLDSQLPPNFYPSGAELCALDDCEEEEEEEEEMPATEKDLAEDAPWKKIQQNTFTRWCNEHLKCVNKRIADLQKDLSDGLRLIGLLEVLSQKKMYRKFHCRPNFRQMKLENVSVALEFLEREHIKLVSIGESHDTTKKARAEDGDDDGV